MKKQCTLPCSLTSMIIYLFLTVIFMEQSPKLGWHLSKTQLQAKRLLPTMSKVNLTCLTCFSNRLFPGNRANSTSNNSSYLISNGKVLYREGLLQMFDEGGMSCRLCHDCWLAISKGKISKFSTANGMWIGDVPDQLKGLTIPEQKLISLYRHNSCIIKLHSPWHSPDTAQPALKGNCITFPQNLSNIATSLPLSPNDLSTSIKIVFIGSSMPSRQHLRKILTVRRQRILDALIWLKENNALYSYISLDQHIIADLPDDDIPKFIWETLDHVMDDENGNAEREGYTEDPLTSDQARSEQATTDFIPLNPSGILDVNGASVTSDEINSEVLHKLRIDSDERPAHVPEPETVSVALTCSFNLWFLFLNLGRQAHSYDSKGRRSCK